jgi:hypothetical protein
MKYKKLGLILLTIIFLVSPWLNSGMNVNTYVPKVSQEDVSFYEINPCKVSLVKFITSNSESIYQNHFYFRADNKSPLICYGRISGVTVLQKGLETQFYISVGTSSIINLLFQGWLWIVLLSLIPKNNFKSLQKNRFHNITIFFVSYLYTFSIYAESRFYDKNLYIFDFASKRSYLLILLIFIFVYKNLIETFLNRSERYINYLPYIFLITSIFSGFNFTFFSSILVYYGIQSLFNIKKKSPLHIVAAFLSLWWLFNSRGSFYFNVGKLRGFTSSTFEFNSNLFWILFSYFLIVGLWKVYHIGKENFSLSTFTKHLSITSFLMVTLGYLSANLPIFNFFNYYFLGLQRWGIEQKNPFSYDDYLVKESWRGLFPSSETIGEYYGLCLIFLLFYIIQSKKLRIYDYIGIFASSFGLYFSDNRTAIYLVFLIILFYMYLVNDDYHFSITGRSKIIIFSTGFIALILLFQFQDFLVSYQFMSQSLITKVKVFQFGNIPSSYAILLAEGVEKSTFFSYVFSFISFVAFCVNRSEMWGLFFARYNPSFNELLFGSGPLNFGQLYGEIAVNNPESLFLPHSSLLSLLVFVGLIPILILVLYFFYIVMKNRHNYEFMTVALYIFTNVIKNDSLNYFSTFVFYILIFLVLKNNNRSEFFKNPSFKK